VLFYTLHADDHVVESIFQSFPNFLVKRDSFFGSCPARVVYGNLALAYLIALLENSVRPFFTTCSGEMLNKRSKASRDVERNKRPESGQSNNQTEYNFDCLLTKTRRRNVVENYQ
jgi:hypothetical protein